MVDEALTSMFSKYIDFANIFSKDLAAKLLQYIRINNHTINLFEDQQLSYKLIYSLKPVELKTLKIYIETNLANNFIKLCKSLAGTYILFVIKPNNSF